MRSPDELTVTVQPRAAVTALVYRTDRHPAGAVLILGHGAGAGQRSTWMVDFAEALSALGVETITFNFLYTEQHKRVPDKRPLLDACYRAVVAAVRGQIGDSRPLFIGGKSMGGRIATHVAADDADLPVDGLVLLGYPLHPPGRPAERRDAHLPLVHRPMLFIQGSRDAFGTPNELRPVLEPLTPPATLHVVEGGDHSFKISRKDPALQAALFEAARSKIVDWVKERAKSSTDGR